MSPLQFPRVAVEFMNRDHAVFAVLREKLLDLLSAEVSNHAEDEALAELGEHDRVLADIATQVERRTRGRDAKALRDWLDQAVGTWLVEHVSSMDFVTAAFAEKNARHLRS